MEIRRDYDGSLTSFRATMVAGVQSSSIEVMYAAHDTHD